MRYIIVYLMIFKLKWINMNIIYIGAFRLPNLDAAAPRVLNNAKVFRTLGHNVQFISWGGQYRKEDLCADGKYRACGFEYRISGDLPLGGSIIERIETKLFRGQKSIKMLKSMPKPDLIIIYNAINSFSKQMIKYCQKNGIKLANDLNEWYDNNELHLNDILPNYINMTHTQHKIRNKIVISSFLNNYYAESNNVIIPPLCDPEETKWSATVEDERVRPFDGITLIYAGNPAKKDCVHTVINAVNTLANEGKAIRFLILGITREAFMKQHAQSLLSTSLHENVMFLGRVSQDLIPAYYKMADFMVLLREPNRKSMAGFPTKFAESMTAGVPVICNATSDLAQYVIHGETGFMVKGFSYEDILDCLRNHVLTLSKEMVSYMRNETKAHGGCFSWNSILYKKELSKFIDSLK